MELEFVAEWFKCADMDFMTSEHLLSMHPKPLEIICYHCQQSAAARQVCVEDGML